MEVEKQKENREVAYVLKFVPAVTEMGSSWYTKKEHYPCNTFIKANLMTYNSVQALGSPELFFRPDVKERKSQNLFRKI